MKQRIFTLLLCVSLLLGLCPSIAAADEWDGWSLPAAATKNQDGSITLTSTNAAMTGATKTQAVGDEFEIETRIKVDQFSGETGFQAYTGKYRLFIRINENNLLYFTGDGTSGSNTSSTVAYAVGNDWHTYQVSVSGNTASLFIDETFIANLSIQTNTGSDRLYLWAKSANGGTNSMTVDYFHYTAPQQEIIPLDPAPVYNDFSALNGWTIKEGGVTFSDGHAALSSTQAGVVQSLSTRVGITEDFDYEFRLKLSKSYGETGAKVEWNGARIMLYFYESETNGSDYFRYTSVDGITSYYFDAAENVVLKDTWHTWKVEVRGNTGTIYMDGRRLVNYRLPAWSMSDSTATFWVKKNDTSGDNYMEVDYAKYTPIFYDVTLTSPVTASAYLEGASIPMAAEADGAESIYYYANGIKIGAGRAPDYAFVWGNAAPGVYEVTAKTPDGEKISKSATIEVKPSMGLRIAADAAYSYGQETVVSVDARDLHGEIAEIAFYRDNVLSGTASGEAETFCYGVLPVGNSRLHAVARSTDGEMVSSEAIWVTVSAGRADLDTVVVPACYELSFTASGMGEAAISAADGWYTLSLPIDHAGEYRIVSDSGAWTLYKDGVLSDSGRSARGTGNGVVITEDGLNLEDFVISASPELGNYYQDVWQGDALSVDFSADMPQAYALEFDLLPGGGTLSMCMSDGVFLTDLTFAPDGITALASPLGMQGSTETQYLAPAPENGKTVLYRVQVSRGIAQLFADNAFVASFRLPEEWGKAYLDAKTSGGAKTTMTALRRTEDRYTYETGFATSDGCWSAGVIQDGHLTVEGGQPALLYAFARNPEFSARIRVPDMPSSGGMYLTTRYNTENAYVRVGYDFASKTYKVIETYVTDQVIAETAGDFPTGEWADVTLALDGASLTLTVNGSEVLKTQQLNYVGFGRIGLFPEEIAVEMDDVSYAGEGKPTPGVTDFTFIGGHNCDMIRLNDGTLKLSGSGGQTFVSKDNGITWTDGGKEAHLYGNTLRLKSGALLSIVREQQPGDNMWLDFAYVSHNDGATWEGPYQVEPVVKNRITMNGKITQAENGRVFFAVGETGHGLEDFGTVGVYYSDDDGRTWQSSKEYISIYNTGVNIQESKVVILPDGTPRLYSRTDRGFLYYTDSSDGGYTWDYDLKLSQFASVLCAFNIERDPYTGKYYAMWVYDNKNEHQTKQYPRYRMALAVSDDCEQWEYLMDVDEFDYQSPTFNRFANLGIDIYEDVIFLNANRFEPTEGDNNRLVNRLYRVEKDSLFPLGRFPNLHLRGLSEPSEAVHATAQSTYAAYLGADTAFLGDRLVACDSAAATLVDGALYLPAVQTARYLGGAYQDGAIVIGTERIALDGMTAQADGTIMVKASLLEEYGRFIHQTNDGLIIISTVESWDDPLMERAYQYIKICSR